MACHGGNATTIEPQGSLTFTWLQAPAPVLPPLHSPHRSPPAPPPASSRDVSRCSPRQSQADYPSAASSLEVQGCLGGEQGHTALLSTAESCFSLSSPGCWTGDHKATRKEVKQAKKLAMNRNAFWLSCSAWLLRTQFTEC